MYFTLPEGVKCGVWSKMGACSDIYFPDLHSQIKVYIVLPWSQKKYKFESKLPLWLSYEEPRQSS